MRMIEIDHLSFRYESDRTILEDITLHADAHESIGIVGKNGVGKSTLLKLLVGLNLNFQGSIRIAGTEVEKENLPVIREKMGYVFQDSESQLFMSTVFEDVAFGPRNYGLSEDEVAQRVEHALEMVNITHLKHRQTYKMSGGEKKMASIATILAMMPDIILMDEPSVALDPKNRRNLINVLNSFNHLKIIASHDLDMILDTCERTVLMAEGRIVKDGPTKELLSNRGLLESVGLELPLCYQKRD